MKLRSVNVSAGRTITWQGRSVRTGIFKKPVRDRVMVRGDNLDGDAQADLTVHGGAFKAVYAYSHDYYAGWEQVLARPLDLGMFGENLTIDGFDDRAIMVGDRVAVGQALLEAVQPRLPCYKLGIRFDDAGMVRRFMKAGRFGTYFRVIQEGEVGAGDSVEFIHRDPLGLPVASLVTFLDRDARDGELARRALDLEALPPQWRELLERSEDPGAVD